MSATGQPVQDTQNMGLGRQPGFQSHFDRGLHRLLIMLQDQRQDFGHYPIAAKGAAWPLAAPLLAGRLCAPSSAIRDPSSITPNAHIG